MFLLSSVVVKQSWTNSRQILRLVLSRVSTKRSITLALICSSFPWQLNTFFKNVLPHGNISLCLKLKLKVPAPSKASSQNNHWFCLHLFSSDSSLSCTLILFVVVEGKTASVHWSWCPLIMVLRLADWVFHHLCWWNPLLLFSTSLCSSVHLAFIKYFYR